MDHPEEQLRVTALFRHPEHSIAYDYLAGSVYPWEALDGLSGFIRGLGPTLPAEEYDHPAADIWIAKTAAVSPSAHLGGPLIVCAGAEIRHCAFIRGSAIVGAGAVVGNSTELKNCVLFDGVQVPHFNYVGDSILGYRAHLGAGAVTSNVKSDKTPVAIRVGDFRVDTGRKKCGAMVGDLVEVGCNCVLNPGTVIGPGSRVYPLTPVRGFIPANSICKSAGNVVEIG